MRRRRRRDIIIELTSLLDVIMIMIFMVMAENSKLIAEKQNALDDVQQENAEKSGEIEDLSNELDRISEELQLALDKLGEGNLDELLQKLRDAESKLDGYDYMDDVVIMVNVELENKYNNAVRCLSFGCSSDKEGEPNSYEIRNENEFNTAINNLKVYVSERVTQITDDESNSTIAYIIFSYDPEKVFQDDYAAIDRALENIEVKANNGNVRYRLNPAEKNK